MSNNSSSSRLSDVQTCEVCSYLLNQGPDGEDRADYRTSLSKLNTDRCLGCKCIATAVQHFRRDPTGQDDLDITRSRTSIQSIITSGTTVESPYVLLNVLQQVSAEKSEVELDSGRLTLVLSLDRDAVSSPTWRHLGSIPLSHDTLSDVAVQVTQGWLSECFDNHTSCPSRNDGVPLPKRTVLISELGASVQLQEHSPGSFDTYVCLSHCWGDQRPLRSTKATIEAHKTHIDWSSLPQTFQDAMLFTHKLGIKHIWIDTLCIIQDDPDDWAEQAGEMADVYTNAYLTLAAVRAKSCDGGLSNALIPGLDHDLRIPADAAGSLSGLIARLALHDKSYSFFERGWIFQEQILSPRTLLFYDREIGWLCSGDPRGKCECRVPGALPVTTGHHLEWQEIIQRYSALKLSYGTDRLPALSGVARAFEQARRAGGRQLTDFGVSSINWFDYDHTTELGQYCAGLWERQFLKQVIWHTGRESMWLGVTSAGGVGSTELPRRERPKTWRAPTWSWASIDAPVGYSDTFWFYQTPIWLPQVISVTCVPKNPKNVLGELQSAAVRLRAPLIDAYIVVYEGAVHLAREGEESDGKQRIIGFTQSLNLDTSDTMDEVWRQGGNYLVTCAMVYVMEKISFSRYTIRAVCLLLRKRGNAVPAVYERVGVARVSFLDWMKPWRGKQLDEVLDLLEREHTNEITIE